MSIHPRPGSLVLYKSSPARVESVADKVELTLADGKNKRVRPKDFELLHPGPVATLEGLECAPVALEEAWELLREEPQTTLQDLAELAFGEYTPATAWSAWKLLEDGVWFSGRPDAVEVCEPERVAAEQQRRAAKVAEREAWEGFLQRLRERALVAEDYQRLREVEQLALQRSERSRILQALGHPERAESAHRFLVEVGYWEETHNPHPVRLDLPVESPLLEIPELPEEPRLDLTHLLAFAIDDEGSDDPDDAITLDGDRIWVHIADAAALIAPDSPLDLEARERAANLYLPDRVIHMLPPGITQRLGLGLQTTSPALSFGFRLDPAGEIVDLEIHPSWVRVSRLSYAAANLSLDQRPFAQLLPLTERYRQRRLAQGAVALDLPEVRVRVRNQQIEVTPLERLNSRELVSELMLMTGEAVAHYAQAQQIAIPFASQPPPESRFVAGGLAEMFAFRRQLKPGRHDTQEEPHAGLGLRRYTRVTSPLRRYLDLVLHQQLRAGLRGELTLPSSAIAERITAIARPGGLLRKGERLSNTHWKLLYLRRNPDWRGRGIVVEREEQRMTLLIPELAMETRMRSSNPPPLNSELPLRLREVDLSELDARFVVG